MLKHAFKFTDKKHSKRGVASMIAGIIALGLIVYAIYMSFSEDGNAGYNIGLLGITAWIAATTGAIFGLIGFKEEDVFYITCYVGSAVNIVCWLFLAAMILIGV